METIFNDVFIRPIINALLIIYHILAGFGIPYALGFSIIFLTVLIRFILFPLTASQLRASKKMQDLNPHLSNIKDKHKGDAKKIQEETMRLYKEHGVNPVSGCLPVLVQLPLLWALYGVLQKIVGLKPNDIVSSINAIAYSDVLRLNAPWDQYFFGLPLGQQPSQLISAMPVVLLIPVITGALQYVQSKMMFPKKPAVKKEEKKGDDFAAAFQTQSTYIFPIMIGVFSYTFPIGLSLYWNTFTLFGILQQHFMDKKARALVVKK